jgi:hypothetical protein
MSKQSKVSRKGSMHRVRMPMQRVSFRADFRLETHAKLCRMRRMLPNGQMEPLVEVLERLIRDAVDKPGLPAQPQ